MQFEAVVITLLEFVVLVMSSIDLSEFRTTKVLYEKCSLSTALAVIVYKSPILCALECSKNVNCKRMMSCTHGNGVECSLFYEGENCATLQPTVCSCFIKSYSKVNNTVVCPLGLYGENCENTIKDCDEGTVRGLDKFNWRVRSYIKPSTSASVFEVVCDFRYGGYNIFMSRNTHCYDVTFNRNLTEYIDGFGDANGDHWLGLTKIKEILENHSRNWLSIVLKHDKYCENFYEDFSVGAASNGYPIQLGSYDEARTHKCGDSLKGSVNIDGSLFSAPGSDHTSFNCADTRQGGWWYADDSRCSECDLMGPRDAMIWPTSRVGIKHHGVALRIRPHRTT